MIGIGGSGSYLVATVPLARFLQWGLPDRLVNPILHGEIVSERGTARTARDIAGLERWRTDLQKPTQERRRLVLLEMQARLLRLAMDLPSEATRRASQAAHVQSEALNKAEEIAWFLAKNYQQPLTTEEIGRAVGLHPNYAMTLFKTVFVTTLTDYLTQQRSPTRSACWSRRREKYSTSPWPQDSDQSADSTTSSGRRSAARRVPTGQNTRSNCDACQDPRYRRRYSRGEQCDARWNASLNLLKDPNPDSIATCRTFSSVVTSNRSAWETRCCVR